MEGPKSSEKAVCVSRSAVREQCVKVLLIMFETLVVVKAVWIDNAAPYSMRRVSRLYVLEMRKAEFDRIVA
jgi:hypothetical protein